MSYKVVRNSDGLVVAFGPNNEHYEPTVKTGETLVIEQDRPTRALTATEFRQERNKRLASSDWTQLADAPVDQAAWAVYRQALRDIPAQAGFPNTVDWPTEP